VLDSTRRGNGRTRCSPAISADSVNMTGTCGRILMMTEPRKMKNNCSGVRRGRTIVETRSRHSE
jgi:hypothetical protein